MKDVWLIALIPVAILAVIVIWHVHKCIKDYPQDNYHTNPFKD